MRKERVYLVEGRDLSGKGVHVEHPYLLSRGVGERFNYCEGGLGIYVNDSGKTENILL